jgi:hypothetical protein
MAVPFNVGSSASDIVTITEPGYYNIVYSASLVAGATGLIEVSLVVNGTSTYSVSETVTAAEDVVNLTLPYVLRVCPNCCGSPNNCPVGIQLQLGDVATSATTPSTANLIVEKIG